MWRTIGRDAKDAGRCAVQASDTTKEQQSIYAGNINNITKIKSAYTYIPTNSWLDKRFNSISASFAE